MYCKDCNRNYDYNRIKIETKIFFKLDEDENRFVDSKFRSIKKICLICGNVISEKEKRIESIYRMKNPTQVESKFVNSYKKLLYKKNYTLKEIQNILYFKFPDEARDFIEVGFNSGIFQIKENFEKINSEKQILYQITSEARNLIYYAIEGTDQSDYINSVKLLFSNLKLKISQWRNLDGRLTIIKTIFNESDETMLSYNNTILSKLVPHNKKYENLIRIFFGLGEILVNKNIFTINDFEREMKLEKGTINKYRSEIESIIGFNLLYCGLLRNVSSKESIIKLPKEYQDDIRLFEIRLRKYISEKLLIKYTFKTLYSELIIPISPVKNKKGMVTRKNLFNSLLNSLRRDIKHTKNNNLRKEKELILQELESKSYPFNITLLEKLLEEFDYKHYKIIFDKEWDFFEIKMDKQLFLEYLHSEIRTYRIDWAHSKNIEVDFIKLNKALFELRSILNFT